LVGNFTDRLDSDWTGSFSRDLLEHEGFAVPDLPPCSAMLLEIGH
jgi:hypothetical protein